MMDILTKPKTYELSKIQEAMIQFRYARNRLKKYGHTEPEPSQLFETLKAAASALTHKDHEFAFRPALHNEAQFSEWIGKRTDRAGIVRHDRRQCERFH